MGKTTGTSYNTVRHQITIPGTSFCAVVDPERVDVSKLLKKLATASGLRATRKADRDRMPVVTVLQPGDVAAPAQDQTTDTATAVPASQLTPWRATYSRKSLEESVAALRAAKLVPSTAKRAKIVKKGELTKKFVLKGVAATAGAKAAIEAAGGSVQE